MKSNILKSLIIISFLLLGCSNDDDNSTNCSFVNPVKDLSWLSEKITEMEIASANFLKYQFINQAVYKITPFHKEQTVFIFNNCCPVCNTVISVYNCNGEFLGVIGPDNRFINPNSLSDSITIWIPKNSECSFPID